TLRLDAIPLADQAERLAWLAEHVPSLPGSGIIYCLTVADTQRVARFLTSQGIDARAYSGPMATPDREALETGLIGNAFKALVATVALGMGFDKPDLGFVIHFQRPTSAIAYYQQVGRAGRAVDRAYGILLSGREDDEIAEYFHRTAFPPSDSMRAILEVLEAVDGGSSGFIQSRINLPKGQLDQALKLLELDGAVARDRSRWFRTPNPWQPDEERIAGVIATRQRELAEMQAYVTYAGCRMEYLTRLLDDPLAGPCGRCANDVGRGLPRTVDADLLQAALEFLRRSLSPIQPRKKWMETGGTPAISTPNEPGIALCRYGDPGWGRAVAQGKYKDGRFSDALVIAAVRAIRDQWRPDPMPEWVTAIPSLGRRTLVGDFATAVAEGLALPYVECLSILTEGQQQKLMKNSIHQLANAREKLGVEGPAVRPGPVLLIDDIVDSGWTLTVAGDLLRAHGSGPVLPFALAVSSMRDD
ncbi:MAG TPA: helicase-related protein, partial [Candidatus Limnocylindrales bacterium]